ncbi:MAG: hypothetical protein FJ368_04295, partial [Pelagibacterales bacterium]|nr:hypothetical protein [Pelagibacterales bacterium]
MTNAQTQNKNDIATIRFDVDEYDNIIVQTYLPSGNVETQSTTSFLWEGFINSLKNMGVLGDINKLKEREVYYETKFNSDVYWLKSQNLSFEDARKAALAISATDFVVEKELIPAAFNSIYNSDTPTEIGNTTIDFVVTKISDQIDDSDIFANAIRDAMVSGLPKENDIFINDQGDIFLLDNNKQMTVKLFSGSENVNFSKINSIATDAAKLGSNTIFIKDSQNENIATYQVKNSDYLLTLLTKYNLNTNLSDYSNSIPTIIINDGNGNNFNLAAFPDFSSLLGQVQGDALDQFTASFLDSALVPFDYDLEQFNQFLNNNQLSLNDFKNEFGENVLGSE